MPNEYVRQAHTHVLFTPGLLDNLPVGIVHHTGDFIWIGVTYSDDLPPDVIQVGDGRNNGYDEDGNRIVSVPLHYVERYMDEQEAGLYVMAADADDRLLRYAR